MAGMKLHSIPYYIDFVGQPIPGTNRKTQNLHILLFGLIVSLDNDNRGCYASKEHLAERLRTTPAKIKNLRADLIKLGWVSVVRNKYGEVTNTYPAEANLISVSNPQVAPPQPTGCTPRNPQVAPPTEVRPQSEYKEEEKDIKRDFDKSRRVCSPLENSAPKDEPTPTTSPFGEDLNRSTIATDVRKSEDSDARARRRAFAIANNVRKRLGLAGQASAAFKQGVQRWLDAGYTEDQIVEANKMMDESGVDYLVNANPLARLAQPNMDWYEKHRIKNQRSGDIKPGDEGYDGLLPITIPGRIY